MEKFRLYTTNLLVATNILEEGIDIPACNLIIRFNRIFNFGSFVQSKVLTFTVIKRILDVVNFIVRKGRARHQNSQYVIMMDTKDQFDGEKDLADFIEIENVGTKISPK